MAAVSTFSPQEALQVFLIIVLPAGSEEHEVLQTGSIHEAILLVNSFTMIHLKCIGIQIIWVVKIRNTSEVVLGPQYSSCHHTDNGPVGLGQYNSLGEYCDPVFLIFIFNRV